MNDGKLQKQYCEYSRHRRLTLGIGLGSRETQPQIYQDLMQLEGDRKGDLSFISTGLSHTVGVQHCGPDYIIMISLQTLLRPTLTTVPR